MIGSHIWEVVQASLIIAAAAVAILGGLTNMVGLVYAVLAFVGLIGMAVMIGVVTRPDKRSPPTAAKPMDPKTEKIGAPSARHTPGESRRPASSPKPVPMAVPAKPPPAATPPYRATDLMKTGIRIGDNVRKSEGLRPSTSPPAEKPRQFNEEPIRRRCEIRAGRVTTVKLRVVKGHYVYGRLWEKDGFDFTWAIVDPKALGLMERRAVFFAQRFERDVPSATVDWTVPSDGPWFLAFDATGKQYIREVEVELWRRSEN